MNESRSLSAHRISATKHLTRNIRWLPASIGAAIVAGGITLIFSHLDQQLITQGDIKFHETIADSSLSDMEPIAETNPVLRDLTYSIASRALEGFAKYREHFSAAELYASERIDDSIAKSARGRALIGDLNSLGFETVREWRSILVSLDVTFRAITQFGENDLTEEETFNTLSGSPRETEPNTWTAHRKIMKRLLENETNRALLEDLVRIE